MKYVMKFKRKLRDIIELNLSGIINILDNNIGYEGALELCENLQYMTKLKVLNIESIIECN